MKHAKGPRVPGYKPIAHGGVIRAKGDPVCMFHFDAKGLHVCDVVVEMHGNVLAPKLQAGDVVKQLFGARVHR